MSMKYLADNNDIKINEPRNVVSTRNIDDNNPSITYHRTRKGVKYENILDPMSGNIIETNKVIDCIFCNIHKYEEPATIVYEDNLFVVFKTIDPASDLHLLVTPREHIQNINSLSGKKGAELIKEMVEIGKKALGDNNKDDAQFCFHMPPWNSIDHLHLHAIAYPNKMNWIGFFKYNTYLPFCQLAENVIKRLNESEKNM